ncbi:MAG: endolytic transglycosylase MltG [bacterium]
MKRFLLRSLLFAVLAALVVGGFLGYRAWAWLHAPLGEGGLRLVTVPDGATFRQAVEAMARAKVVSEPLIFEWYGRYRGAGRNIKAGTYQVDMALNPMELLDKLEAGELPRQARLTVPEGWNRWQIADRVVALTATDRADFLRRVEAEDLEGRLFPDTYFLRPDADAAEVLKQLTRRFDQVFADVIAGHRDAAKLAKPGPERRRLIIMASLVEKEATTQRDRRLVARVFYNRIEKGMKLQTDPTCTYREDWYARAPHPRYCKAEGNRYSTYLIEGLPPGPIANPGRAALDAALRPADDPAAMEYLYFVARRDGSGEHAFTRTYAEHKAAVDRYLKGITP